MAKVAAPLKTIYLEILHGCNLRCTYCYVGDDKNHRTPYVAPAPTLRRRLENLRAFGVRELILLGGEPLLHPQLPEIIADAASLAFSSLGVVTNGTVVTPATIELLQRHRFWVNVTLRGSQASSFDGITGSQGTFEGVMASVARLKDAGISIGIEYDCTPSNYLELYDAVSQVITMGASIKQVQLHRILPAGNALHSSSPLVLQLDKWEAVLGQAQRLADDFQIPVGVEDGLPLCLIPPPYWPLLLPCGCGYSQLTIDPYGEARFCACHESSLGNIDAQELDAIWESALNAYRSSTRLPEPCQQCGVAERCRGGCTASGRGPMVGGFDVWAEHFRPLPPEDAPAVVRSFFGQAIVDVK